jgi:hypothetical protein
MQTVHSLLRFPSSFAPWVEYSKASLIRTVISIIRASIQEWRRWTLEIILTLEAADILASWTAPGTIFRVTSELETQVVAGISPAGIVRSCLSPYKSQGRGYESQDCGCGELHVEKT